MTEVHARKRGNNCTTFSVFKLEVLRFPFSENEARCFAVQYVNETVYNPNLFANIRIISELTMQKAKKVAFFCQNTNLLTENYRSLYPG